MYRTAKITRNTNETKIEIELFLDGDTVDISTGIGFFDHMLTALAHHGAFGLTVKAEGDLIVDCHHTIEDTGIALGHAFQVALGNKSGIKRFGNAIIPMDEALSAVVIDISGRPFLVFTGQFPQERIGDYDTCMTEEFFRAFSENSGITIHADCKYGKNAHHMIEAVFKALAHSLKQAVELTGNDFVLSTKGSLIEDFENEN